MSILALVALTMPLMPAEQPLLPQAPAAVEFLLRQRAATGGFQPFRDPGAQRSAEPPPRPTLMATVAAVRALRIFGGRVPDIERCRRFVRGCYVPAKGGFGSMPAEPPEVINSALGLMAATELAMPTDEYRDAVAHYLGEHAHSFEEIRMAVAGLEAIDRLPAEANQWRRQIEAMANSDGSFGHGDGMARETASAAMTLLRLGERLNHRDRIIQVLQTGQRRDGGFGRAGAPGSDLETTYRVLRAMHMLGIKPANANGCRSFVEQCRNTDGGYGIAPGKRSQVTSTYFAGAVLRWLNGS